MRNTPIRPTGAFVRGVYTQAGWAFLYLDDFFEGRVAAFEGTIDEAQREAIAAEIAQHAYELRTHIPLASTFVEIAVNPRRITGWRWPAQSPTVTSHWYTLELAD